MTATTASQATQRTTETDSERPRNSHGAPLLSGTVQKSRRRNVPEPPRGKFPPPVLDGLRIEYRLLSELVPDVRNARTHSPKQVRKIEASLLRFGWTTPLLIAGDGILAGHARHRAASNLAASGQRIARHEDPLRAPTLDLSALSVAEQRAYMIADNRLASEAGWDNDLLRLEFSELKTAGFDLSLTGFSVPDLNNLFGVAGPAAGARLGSLQYDLVIACDDEAHQAALLDELAARGLKVRPLIV